MDNLMLSVLQNKNSRKHHLLFTMRLDLRTKDFMRCLSFLECGILRLKALISVSNWDGSHHLKFSRVRT